MENNRKFERSTTNRVFGGVCSGLADYFNFDVSLMRVLFVIAAFCASFGLWLYIILWIVTPAQKTFNYFNPQQDEPIQDPVSENPNKKRGDGALIMSIILIAIGLIALVDNFLYIDWIWKLWPVILIALGVVIIINAQKNQKNG